MEPLAETHKNVRTFATTGKRGVWLRILVLSYAKCLDGCMGAVLSCVCIRIYLRIALTTYLRLFVGFLGFRFVVLFHARNLCSPWLF